MLYLGMTFYALFDVNGEQWNFATIQQCIVLVQVVG